MAVKQPAPPSNFRLYNLIEYCNKGGTRCPYRVFYKIEVIKSTEITLTLNTPKSKAITLVSCIILLLLDYDEYRCFLIQVLCHF